MLQEFLSQFNDPFPAVSWPVALSRMVAALAFGGLIGWEREAHEKPAGLRTHMMVSLASCLFAILTFELIEIDLVRADPDTLRTDPIRLIEAITAGVAFLAAGTIFTSEDKVRGLTTGAGLWLAGAIGVACGIGRLPLAAMATVLTILVLTAIRWVAVATGAKHRRH